MISIYQGKRTLDKIFGSVDFTNEKLYIGVSKTDVQANGAGVSEATGGGYARKQISNTKEVFTSADGNMSLSNKVAIEFAESTADWGRMTHVFISDAPTGGNVLYYEALARPITVEAYTTLRFKPNEMIFSLSNN